MFEPLTYHLHAWLRRNGVGRAAPPARVGVQLGTQQIRLLRLVPQGAARPRVELAEVLQCDLGTRAITLRRAAQAGAFRFAAVHLVLPAADYEIHQMPAPPVPEDELREAIRFQLRSVLAYPPEDAVVDFARVAQPADQAARATVLAVSARASVINDAARGLVEAGVEIDSIDVPEFAQRNLCALRSAVEGTQAWLSFEGESCLLTVQLGDELCFSRRIQLPPLHAAGKVVDLDAEAAMPAWPERIANHVLRSLDLFERQSGLPPVLHLTVAPHAQAAATALAVAQLTGIDADVFDPTALFDLAPAVSNGRLPRAELLADCVYALGAALRGSQPAGAPSATAGARHPERVAQPA